MATHAGDGTRTLAQWFSLIVGATLVLVGIVGFFVDSTFDTGGDIDGDRLIIFEVNGIHNLVHIASGLLLLAAANTAPSARIIALVFGATYGLVALIGLIDGKTVLGLFPVNPADNVLHIVLALASLAAGAMSPTRKGRSGRRAAADDRRAGDSGTGYAHRGQRDVGADDRGERRH